ncbi:MAG: hypothetical protein HUU20_15000, partial [Pirellulales bacterium]|nr:hypothetical protein [Pirellulales bacterium]
MGGSTSPYRIPAWSLFALLGLALAWLLSGPAHAEPKARAVPKKEPAVEMLPRPESVPPADPEKLQSAIARGVEFLVARQNRDGSWGSAHNTKGLNIYAPVPGAHHAFRTAVTAMCISALIEVGVHSDPERNALERGEAWLLENVSKLRRAEPEAIYNNWGHAYAIDALVHMHGRLPDDKKRQQAI